MSALETRSGLADFQNAYREKENGGEAYARMDCLGICDGALSHHVSGGEADWLSRCSGGCGAVGGSRVLGNVSSDDASGIGVRAI